MRCTLRKIGNGKCRTCSLRCWKPASSRHRFGSLLFSGTVQAILSVCLLPASVRTSVPVPGRLSSSGSIRRHRQSFPLSRSRRWIRYGCACGRCPRVHIRCRADLHIPSSAYTLWRGRQIDFLSAGHPMRGLTRCAVRASPCSCWQAGNSRTPTSSAA